MAGEGQIDFKQIKGTPVITILDASPDTPPADGYLFLYPKSDNRFYQMDSAGMEKAVDSTAIQYFFEMRRLLGILVGELRKNDLLVMNDELLNLTILT